jgi:hypothetical protein
MAIHHPELDIGVRVDGIRNGRAAPRRQSGGTPPAALNASSAPLFDPTAFNPASSMDPERLAVWETDGGRVTPARDSTSRPLGVCPSCPEHGAGDTRASASAEVRTGLAEAKADLLRTHHGVLEDPRNDVEGLDGAGCSSFIKDLARLAMGADAQGLSAEGWRTWVVDGLGPEAGSLLGSAETCMRASGLWPWRN